MEALTKVTVIFTLALALTLLIERVLEILKSFYDVLDSRNDWYRYWNGKTKRIKTKLEKRLKVFDYVDVTAMTPVLNRFREVLLGKPDENLSNAPILSGDLVRAFYTKIAFKLIGILIGIGLAFWFRVDLFKIWQESAVDPTKWHINIESCSVRLIITGIAMGLGAGPMHKIITTIEKKRNKQKQKREAV